jgi:hypothetical protein
MNEIVMAAQKQTFNLGDRVEIANEEARERLFSMRNGIVVKYKGKHDPKNPRVRWASGWGVTSKAKDLRLMTIEERASLPMPIICDIDI